MLSLGSNYRQFYSTNYTVYVVTDNKISFMRTIVINNKKLVMYDSIEELPIINFQKYNKYLLIDAGIGSDVNDIDQHISKIAKYIKSDKTLAMQELQNMRQNMFMIASGISPKYLAFAALIHSVDDKKVEDLSDENLKAVLESLRAVKHSWLINLLAEIKKKIQAELELYFPQEFINAKEKEAYDRLKSRTLLVLERVTKGKDTSSEINSIDDYLFNLHKPKSFAGNESVEIKYDKQFESMCLIISQKSNQDARCMTVLQFYSSLENIKAQLEAENKAYKKHHRR